MREEILISGIQNRDAEAINRAMDQYSRLLWSVAEAVLGDAGNAQDVEECVADAFIHLWEHPEKFDPNRGKLRSYLCMLVRSRAIDRYRELMRRSMLPLEEAELTETLGLQEGFLKKETQRELLTAVKELKEPDREILVRRYYHDQKPRQIALALGLTVKQVDNRLYHTKQLLRRILEERR